MIILGILFMLLGLFGIGYAIEDHSNNAPAIALVSIFIGIGIGLVFLLAGFK